MHLPNTVPKCASYFETPVSNLTHKLSHVSQNCLEIKRDSSLLHQDIRLNLLDNGCKECLHTRFGTPFGLDPLEILGIQ